MDKRYFKKLNKAQKLEVLREESTFVANRLYQGFIVSLFLVENYYVEIWKRVGLDYIEYIEVVNETNRLADYVQQIDLKNSLGL